MANLVHSFKPSHASPLLRRIEWVGLAAHQRRFISESSHYSTLGVAREASAQDIKTAYINLSRKFHPDLNVNENPEAQKRATETFLKIGAAYSVLSDPLARRDYDLGVSNPRNYNRERNASTPESRAYHENRRYGFYQGTYTGTSPYKVFSDVSIIMFAVAFMVLGGIFHYIRFQQSRDEIAAASEKANQTAAAMLATAIAQGQSNGVEKQLQRLRDLHEAKTKPK